jgi:MerR family mercuric resistance operon transcriptional regulator
LTTGAVCVAAQVTRGQLRLYEREGLLLPPERTEGGFRIYPLDTLARLQAIRQLKEIGFKVAEIGMLLAEGDAGLMDEQRIRTIATEQLQSIDQRIANLNVVRMFVAAVAGGDLTGLNDPECNFLVKFLENNSLGKNKEK